MMWVGAMKMPILLPLPLLLLRVVLTVHLAQLYGPGLGPGPCLPRQHPNTWLLLHTCCKAGQTPTQQQQQQKGGQLVAAQHLGRILLLPC
jgi:hypothetical protein